MKSKKEYIDELNERLNQWRAKMKELESRAAEAPEESRKKYAELAEKLEAKMVEADKAVEKLNAAADTDWESHKEKVEKLWKDLGDLFADTLSTVTTER
ncbi:hypothetical protein GF420_11665 [candidate division GN15 bacterium]|nr:hypothetical protein [candidate division GN15 bacterium]